MGARIRLGGIVVEVVKKDIKNIHLSVHPPKGRVRISAPLRMNLNTIRVFAITKLSWIKSRQQKLRKQERETPREYLDRESHYVWGNRYVLEVIENVAAPKIELKGRKVVLKARRGTSRAKKQAILEAWYRELLKEAIATLIKKWEPVISVKVKRFFVQRMKTKWGSCNTKTKSLRLNTELAKKPRECLEYIVVHEMVHILERTHNSRFKVLMNQFMPKWRFYRDELNRLPVRHEKWSY